MRYKTDISLDSKSLVIGLVNHDNGLTLDAGSVTLSNVITNTASDITQNTQAQLSTGYYNGQDTLPIWYNRLKPEEALPGFPVIIGGGGYTRINELTDILNATLGTAWSAEEIVDGAINFTERFTTLTMASDCAAWVGGFPVTILATGESVVDVGSDADTFLLCFTDDDVMVI